jgi:membrane-bound serine protease (ClpP class)
MMGARFWRALGTATLAGLAATGPAAAVPPGQLPAAPGARPVVYVVPINGVIDLGLALFVERVLAEAATTRAAAVILEVNTFGGHADAAVVMRDALLKARVRTVAFVDTRAISAGALVSLAAETIAMAPGATIGAAPPITMGARGERAHPGLAATLASMREAFRVTAETRKRPPLLAEAMVDAGVEIPGLGHSARPLTLTTEEALRHGIVDFRAASVEAVLTALGLAGAAILRVRPAWAETLAWVLTEPRGQRRQARRDSR